MQEQEQKYLFLSNFSPPLSLLGVTVILAFSVFMLAIAEKMPETSESIPLIGT